MALVGLEGSFERLNVIEGHDYCVLGKCRGNTGAVRVAEGESAGTGFDQQRIGMAMVTAIELDDLFPPGKSARKPDCRHRRFGPGIAHANLLNAWHHRADEPCHGDFEGIWNAEARSVFCCLLDRADDLWMRMAEDGGTPRAHIIHVFIAIHVPNMGAPGFVDEKGLAANGAKSADR